MSKNKCHRGPKIYRPKKKPQGGYCTTIYDLDGNDIGKGYMEGFKKVLYVGRKIAMGGHNLPESLLHNPYKPGQKIDGKKISGARCVELYENLLKKRIREDPEKWFTLLRKCEGKVLGCWCKKPKPCHTDTLVKLVNILTLHRTDPEKAQEKMQAFLESD